MTDRIKAILATIFFVMLLFFVAVSMTGCATTGSISPEIIQQSAEVDTAISQLQTAQSNSTAAIEQIDATQQDITSKAKIINDEGLTGLVEKQNEQIKKLKESKSDETKTTSTIQTTWSTVKVNGGTTTVNDSDKINKLTISRNSWRKRCIISWSILALIVLTGIALEILKFYLHKF